MYMIKYNLNNINDWNYGDDNIKKVYHHNSVCYQKIYGGTIATPKWIATYEGGVTSSAECDASSAITRNEISLTHLVAVEIGDCVTSIGNYVFQSCNKLTSITIGSGVTSIGNWAFKNCSGLTSVTVKATTPPTLGSIAFYYTNSCPIYVPSESVETYKSASGWSDYASRIQAIPT